MSMFNTIRAVLRKMRIELIKGNISVDMLCGVNVTADATHPGWMRLAKNRWWELETDLFMAAVLADGDVVVDVGANEGILTVLAGKLVGAKGQVHAFEPDKALVGMLEHAVKINELSNVRINQLALTEKDGYEDFICDATSPYAKMGEGNKVPCMTLDTYCQNNNIKNINLLKIDIDGGELKVLRGAESLLKSGNSPMLIVELSNESLRLGYKPMDIVDYLKSLGYVIYGSRMKFAHLVPINDESSFEQLPVRFEKNEVSNIFCLRPEIHISRLMTCIWPPQAPLSYSRHFLSTNPYPNSREFWIQYQAEIEAYFNRSIYRRLKKS